MIPKESSGPTFDRSIRYNVEEVCATLADIDDFLKRSNVTEENRFKINLCCEELMTNIALHSEGKVTSQTFDVHIHVSDEGTYVTLKDAGKPFDPVKAGKMADPEIGSEGNGHLGLRLVTNIIPDISYKYMYGQNTVFIELAN
jgi:anti-sigma regulatory factor (Ser/Thr protein kinase)